MIQNLKEILLHYIDWCVVAYAYVKEMIWEFIAHSSFSFDKTGITLFLYVVGFSIWPIFKQTWLYYQVVKVKEMLVSITDTWVWMVFIDLIDRVRSIIDLIRSFYVWTKIEGFFVYVREHWPIYIPDAQFFYAIYEEIHAEIFLDIPDWASYLWANGVVRYMIALSIKMFIVWFIYIKSKYKDPEEPWTTFRMLRWQAFDPAYSPSDLGRTDDDVPSFIRRMQLTHRRVTWRESKSFFFEEKKKNPNVDDVTGSTFDVEIIANDEIAREIAKELEDTLFHGQPIIKDSKYDRTAAERLYFIRPYDYTEVRNRCQMTPQNFWHVRSRMYREFCCIRDLLNFWPKSQD
jgi:hypothetical protein